MVTFHRRGPTYGLLLLLLLFLSRLNLVKTKLNHNDYVQLTVNER